MKHDIVLDCLLKLKAARSVHLVARTTLSGATLPSGKVWFFIPDLHLLTKRSAENYQYSFVHDKGGKVARHALLAELGRGLARLRAREPNSLYVFQLGDFIDIWRENRIAEIEDLTSLAQRVIADNPAAKKYLVDAKTLGASLVLGNHDHVGSHSLARDDAFRRMKTAYVLPKDGHIVATHGDLFDPIEGLPDRWSRWGSRFTTVIHSTTTNLNAAKRITDPSHVPKSWGVKKKHRLLAGAIRMAKGLRSGHAPTLRRLRLRKKRPVKVFAIGHTHHACLAIKDGVVLLDCGAWLERCKVGGKVVPSCQIGVIAGAPKGADLRIYQLTPA